MSIQTIMVVGAGQMGSGIAQVAASAGRKVLWHDLSMPLIDKGMLAIRKQLDRSVVKGRLTEEEKVSILSRIQSTGVIEEAEKVDLVIEAISENMSWKTALFQKLDVICPPHVIMATNTSSLPITEIAAATTRPRKLSGCIS